MANGTGFRRFGRGNVPVLQASVGILLIFLAGCRIEPITPAPAETQTQTPTVPLPLASLLPTLENTPTSPPADTPTPAPRNPLPPEAGDLLFRDALSSNRLDWPLPTGSAGMAAFSETGLTFTVRTPNIWLVSVAPREIPADVYIELTVTTTICGSEGDSFGIIFRARGDQQYRYAVTCAGRIRLEKYSDTGMNANAWQDAPGLLQGAPAENRIGVLVKGRDFRFFVSGLEIYAASEPVIPSGGLGVFARTDKSNLLTVSFSNLAVYALKVP